MPDIDIYFTLHTSQPFAIYDKGDGLALSLYPCGDLKGCYGCAEDVNTFATLLVESGFDARQP
jgi:hypothetical protein